MPPILLAYVADSRLGLVGQRMWSELGGTQAKFSAGIFS